MKKDIENKFFKVYQLGGIVDDCIDEIQNRYDVGYLSSNKPLPEMWQKYYNEKLPNKIREYTEAFDDTVILTPESPLINEISDNLSECKTMQEKEYYIHSLIVPFRKLSELFHPEKAPKQRIEKELNELQKSEEFWKGLTSKDFNDFEIDDKKLTPNEAKDEAIKHLEAVTGLIKNRSDQYKRLKMISKRYWQILNEPTDDVEKSLSAFCNLMFIYANRLDALLLQNRIDFLRSQSECGVYLKTNRIITDVDFYIGSLELTEKYISELPKTETKISKQKDRPELLSNAQIRILYKGLKGCFTPYDIKHLAFAINGGAEPPKGYDKLHWERPSTHMVYLNRLLCKGDWSICKEFSIYTAKQTNNKFIGNDPPPGGEYITELINRIKEA